LNVERQDELTHLEYLVKFDSESVMMWTNLPPQKGINFVAYDSGFHLGILQEKLVRIIHQDISTIIEPQLTSSYHYKNIGDDFFNDYHTLADINSYLQQLSSTFPKMARTFTIGKTYEGRSQTGIVIGTNVTKPVIFFEGGVHAREWISPATVTYMAYRLLEDYDSKVDSTRDLVDNLLWVFLPVTNPDGYSYSWTNDRMWRKNRFPTGFFRNNTECIGIDLNRNWNYSFSSDDPNPNPCAENYPGKQGFDQSETKTLTDIIKSYQKTNGIYLYIDWHSCGQLWMYPWAFSKNQAPFWDLQIKMGTIALNALTPVYGTKYDLGPIAEIIYQVGGSSVDWTFDVQSIIYSYGVELRDTGQYCFLLPPNQIIPTGQETFDGIKAATRYLLQNPPFIG